MRWILILVAVLALAIGCQPNNSELWDLGRTYAKGDYCQTEGTDWSGGSWSTPCSGRWDYASLQDGNKGHNPDQDCQYTGEGFWWKCLGFSSE